MFSKDSTDQGHFEEEKKRSGLRKIIKFNKISILSLVLTIVSRRRGLSGPGAGS